jgi:hypothetical protein
MAIELGTLSLHALAHGMLLRRLRDLATKDGKWLENTTSPFTPMLL